MYYSYNKKENNRTVFIKNNFLTVIGVGCYIGAKYKVSVWIIVTFYSDVLAGHDRLDSTTIRVPFQEIKLDEEPSIKNLKVGIPKEYHCEGLSKEVLDVWTEMANLLERSGAEVHEVVK